MKKIFLFSTLLSFAYAFPQMTVKKLDGTVIKDGDVFTYETANTEDSQLKFSVYNTSTTSGINARIDCESLENTNGGDFEFCFGGNCMPFVIAGQSYPGDAPYYIAPGSNSGDSDHFWNMTTESSTGVYPMKFTFKFYQTDDLGNEIGTPIRMTYQYTKPLAVNESSFEKSGIQIQNTLVSDILKINSRVNTSAQIFDLSGRQVKSVSVYKGENSFNIQNLKPGTYLFTFKNSEGKLASYKILKK